MLTYLGWLNDPPVYYISTSGVWIWASPHRPLVARVCRVTRTQMPFIGRSWQRMMQPRRGLDHWHCYASCDWWLLVTWPETYIWYQYTFMLWIWTSVSIRTWFTINSCIWHHLSWGFTINDINITFFTKQSIKKRFLVCKPILQQGLSWCYLKFQFLINFTKKQDIYFLFLTLKKQRIQKGIPIPLLLTPYW